MARYFVFVEFSDPQVREFLTSLRNALVESRLSDVPHITVRGPYSTPPDPGYIEELAERLHGQGVLIADVGMFQTRKGFAVFLYAKSKLFEDIWWKPDFAGPVNRRIPHVTVYESTSEARARTVSDFLRSEGIEIVTYGVELTVYTSKQQSLLGEEDLPLPNPKPYPQERMIFRDGIVQRASALKVFLNKLRDDNDLQKELL